MLSAEVASALPVQQLRLADVADIVMGQSPPGNTYNDQGVGPPFFQGKAEFGEVSPIAVKWCSSPTRIAEAGDILISVRAPVGPTNVVAEQCCIGRGLAAIRPDPNELDRDYLLYFFKHVEPSLSDRGQGSTFSAINKKDLHEMLVPVPPLSEQRRIVNILKRADGIRRLRKQAQDTACQLIPALFIDMFGDPAANPKGWPIRKVSDFVERFEGGKNLKAGSNTPENCRILKVSAVTSGIYKENESKPAPDGYTPPKSYYVCEGDLLFSRANTEALVGATALVDRTNGKTLLPDKLWRFVWAEEIEPIYIYALFQNSDVRRELSRLSTGTSASMRNISQGKLKNLELPVAPLKLQKKFSERVIQVQVVQVQQSTALTTSTLMFNSLLNRAFSGQQ